MSSTYTIWPLRMSHAAAATISLFVDLGLRQTVGHEGGTYAVFTGRSGTLGVHDAGRTAEGSSPSSTGFNLLTADVERAAAELRAAGLEVRVWDETYGKQGMVDGPGGLYAGLNEQTQADLYGGYTTFPATEQTIAASMDVVVTCFTPDPAAAAEFFAHFGFASIGADGSGWVELRASTTSGTIELHPPLADAATPSFAIGFETSEPLDALAHRLAALGHRASVVDDDLGTHVEITDPDEGMIYVGPTS